MRFSTFKCVNGDDVAINAAAVFSVARRDDRTVAVFGIGQGGMDVVGSVAEVVAALEAAGAPDVAPVVEVEPMDLERAAKVLDLLADSAKDFSFVDGVAVDKAIGANGIEWTDSVEKASALAARLRGAR